MSESDGVPTRVEREHTVATRAAVLEDARKRLESDIKELRADTLDTFKRGAQSMSDLRAEIQRVRDVVEGKLSARHAAVGLEAATVRAELDAKITAVGASVLDLANQVAPRATTLRLIGWAALLLATVGGPALVYLKTPSTEDIRELDNRVRTMEMRITEIGARLGVITPKGAP